MMVPPREGADAALLRAAFRAGGYCRMADMEKRERAGSQRYKKGYEVRLVVATRAELAEVRRALRAVGFRDARSFLKHGKFAQPVYGRDAVRWFTG
jgi:hypothetical protein